MRRFVRVIFNRTKLRVENSNTKLTMADDGHSLDAEKEIVSSRGMSVVAGGSF